jgi:hypothetical protein
MRTTHGPLLRDLRQVINGWVQPAVVGPEPRSPNLQPLVIFEKGSQVKALVCTRCRRTQLKAAK